MLIKNLSPNTGKVVMLCGGSVRLFTKPPWGRIQKLNDDISFMSSSSDADKDPYGFWPTGSGSESF
jgi:hypothetical protein